MKTVLSLAWAAALLAACTHLFGAAPASTSARLPRAWLVPGGGVSGIFDAEKNPMLSLEYRWEPGWQHISPWIHTAWATDGATFLGAGFLLRTPPSKTWVLQIGFGPGYYERNNGQNLGSHLEFLSFGEVSYALPSRRRVAVRLAHISNGSVNDHNPGTELLTLSYAIPLP